MSLAPVGLLCVFGFAACLLWAAASDVRWRTIPNWVSLAIAGLFGGFALAGGDIGAWWSAPAAGAGVFAAGLAAFAFGWLGGGDVKLASAIALWAGVPSLTSFLMVTVFTGALLAVATVAARQFPIPYLTTNALFVGPQTDGREAVSEGMPYGLAIAAGGLWILYRVLAA